MASDNHANTPPLGFYRLDAETTASKNQKSWKQICGADALVGDQTIKPNHFDFRLLRSGTLVSDDRQSELLY